MPDASVTITGQQQMAKVLDDGAVHDVIEVRFRVGEDGPFMVDVPVANYQPETVQAMVDNMATRVRNLRADYS